MDIEECISRPSSTADGPLIVAVACFAGDISAPSELVSALPADCRAAFIFVQQLSRACETQALLATSLMGRTTLPVINARGGLMVERGFLYVIPLNVIPTMTGARICVTPLASATDCPADALFTSLAQEFGSNAIGVVLSGGDSDRALGIRAIKQAGGITFAQYPGSARFPNTLISAIDTGCVDFVLRPDEIAHELARIGQFKETAARGTLKHTQITRPEPIPTRSALTTAIPVSPANINEIPSMPSSPRPTSRLA
jgi:two-component system, chemotaxis family, CheB/CheR fusion protein